MNPGQQMFYDFYMQRVQPGQETEAKAMMEESFKRQDEGTFDMAYMGQLMPKMIAMLKPECVEEFQAAAAHMRSTLNG